MRKTIDVLPEEPGNASIKLNENFLKMKARFFADEVSFYAFLSSNSNCLGCIIRLPVR
ncbi:hypothetical protein YERSI8AC_100045 [Enterobacterales bacterium 8AC]|nr:hypothetical protein YERSI8AC_100045 [Enterobacterales bacterium 8AC]